MQNSLLSKLMAERVGPTFEFGGYRIRRAVGAEDERACFELRHRVFLDEGFLEPDQFPDGLFVDRFDANSTHILVFDDGGDLVATTRFVRPSLQQLPVESLFDFVPPPVDRSRIGEYGRLAIKPEHRGGGRAPMLGMLKAVFECMVEGKVSHVYAFLSPELADSYARLGCVSVPLVTKSPSAETVANRRAMRGYFEKQSVIPVLFDLHEMMLEVGVSFDRGDLEFVRKGVVGTGGRAVRVSHSQRSRSSVA